MAERFDLAILGGGCAGLALGRDLALRQSELRVIIIEPREHYTDDRTWCFWSRADATLRPAPRATWSRWHFSRAGQSIHHVPEAARYHLVSSADYYRDAVRVIDAAPGITLRYGTHAGSILHGADAATIETSRGPVCARWIIDTRPPSTAQLRRAPLAQLFSGVEVELDHDVFDPASPALMADMRTEDGGFAFDYILPFSARRALIEHTLFTPQPHDPSQLDADCMARVNALCGPGARIIRRERGWLPMGLPTPPRQNGRVFLAGMTGGAVRPSSGYAFVRIQRWAAACADHLIARGRPLPAPSEPVFLSAMDRIFLSALTRNMDAAPDYFIRIARALDGDAFARFMTDDATPSDWLRIVAALPKLKFLSATRASLLTRREQQVTPC